MEQLGEKGEEHRHSSQESSDHRCKRGADAAAVLPEGVHGESTDQRDEAETTGVIKEQLVVEVVEEEQAASASAPLLARPCSMLQLLFMLRACAGCLLLSRLLHGYCSDNDDYTKPAADDDDVSAAAAVAESSWTQEVKGSGDDDTAAAGSEVATQVLAARRPPPPPGPPEEGSGGHGGNHN